MSDRINWITVVLEKDIRDDDCEDILTALRMVKGVLSVKPNVATAQDWLVYTRVRTELAEKLWKALEK